MALKTPNLETEVTARPSFPIKSKHDWPGVQQVFLEDGIAQSWFSRGNTWRRFTLVYEHQTDAQIDSLIAFLIARRGSYELFYWDFIQTGEDDIPVKLSPKFKPDYTFDTAVDRTVTIELIEVFDG